VAEPEVGLGVLARRLEQDRLEPGLRALAIGLGLAAR